MLSRRFVPLLGLAALSVPSLALADSLSATLGQPMKEVAHTVDLHIEDNSARYVVRRSFANEGTRSEEAELDLDLPFGAAATGLRIRARTRWYDGELLDADVARARYRELTGLGTAEPKDPALLQWRWADRLNLHVFPVLPKAANTVEYTLTAPLRYRAGKLVFTYPRGANQDTLVTPVLTVYPAHGDAMTPIWVDGVRVPPERAVTLSPPPEAEWFGEGSPTEGRGRTFSELMVAEAGEEQEVTVTLRIDHTYRGDLRVGLVTPSGKHVAVTQGQGGENDIVGAFSINLPHPEEKRGRWYLLVEDQAGFDTGTLESWSLSFGEGKGTRKLSSTDVPKFVPDAVQDGEDASLSVIEVAPPAIDTLRARFATVTASAAKRFTRVEVEAAPELRPVPKKARMVFILDASYSQPEEALATQLQAMNAVVRHVPDAQVQVIATRRTASLALPDWTTATSLPAALEAARQSGAFVQGNGSEMGIALEEAERILRDHAGPRRIVSFTDALLKTRFDVAAESKALGARAVAHVVAFRPRDGAVSLTRDDEHPLSPLANKSGGVLYRLDGLGPEPNKDAPEALLQLVRPTRIDHFTVNLGSSVERPDQEWLLEGTGFRVMKLGNAAPGSVTLSGMIWGKRWSKALWPTQGFQKATAAFVFGEDEHQDLSEEEMMRVAMVGRAVSPVTSYLAIEPGVRPSRDGLPPEMTRLGAFGGSGQGFGGGGTAHRSEPTLDALVGGIATACANKLQTTRYDLHLSVETTRSEIVDIWSETPQSPLLTCLVESLWGVRLDSSFRSERRQHQVHVMSHNTP